MKRYEVLQHADDLSTYYVRNRATGRRVVARVSYGQACKTANDLERIAEEVAVTWPREIDTDTKR